MALPPYLGIDLLGDRTEKYNLGENEFHLALITDDFDAAYEHHKRWAVSVTKIKTCGIYFIADPDGYWIEILPNKRWFIK